MGAPKYKTPAQSSDARTAAEEQAQLKSLCIIYQTKIIELLKGPKASKKAALIIEKMLKSSS